MDFNEEDRTPSMNPYTAFDALIKIERERPCLDAETTDADLAEWCRLTIIPTLNELGLL